MGPNGEGLLKDTTGRELQQYRDVLCHERIACPEPHAIDSRS